MAEIVPDRKKRNLQIAIWVFFLIANRNILVY